MSYLFDKTPGGRSQESSDEVTTITPVSPNSEEILGPKYLFQSNLLFIASRFSTNQLNYQVLLQIKSAFLGPEMVTEF